MNRAEIARASTRELEARRSVVLGAEADSTEAETAFQHELWDIDDELDKRREDAEQPRDDTPALNPPWWEAR